MIGSAYWIAAVRARESARPDRLFDDPWAGALAGARGVAAMERSEAASGGENAYLPVRVRFFDDLALRLTGGGVDQVVLLGAGLDTRPYRLPLPVGVTWFEVDRAEVLDDKRRALGDAVPRCALRDVSGDVDVDLRPALAAAGWRADRPTAWIAEGLLYYLSAGAVDALLATTAAGSAPGSAFAADVLGASGLAGPGLDAYRRYAASAGLPPPYGHDDPAALFAAAGWPVTTLTWAGAPDANYGRLPAVPPGPAGRRANLVVGSR